MASIRSTSLLAFAAAAAAFLAPATARAYTPLDTTPPTLGFNWDGYSSYWLRDCGIFQKTKFGPLVSLSLDEPATLEFVGVHKGFTRKITRSFQPGFQELPLYTGLIGQSTGPVTVTITPTDSAGNRGTPRAHTIPVKYEGYRPSCNIVIL